MDLLIDTIAMTQDENLTENVMCQFTHAINNARPGEIKSGTTALKTRACPQLGL